MEYLFRFFAGAIAVSAFALLGDLLRPKSFAGLFAAAPAIAFATLTITLWQRGGAYAAVEGRSMMFGSLALAAYSTAVCQLIKRCQMSSLAATMTALPVWFVVSFGFNRLLPGAE